MSNLSIRICPYCGDMYTLPLIRSSTPNDACIHGAYWERAEIPVNTLIQVGTAPLAFAYQLPEVKAVVDIYGAVRTALVSLPEDALGLDTRTGHPYRDELVYNLDTTLAPFEALEVEQ